MLWGKVFIIMSFLGCLNLVNDVVIVVMMVFRLGDWFVIGISMLMGFLLKLGCGMLIMVFFNMLV